MSLKSVPTRSSCRNVIIQKCVLLSHRIWIATHAEKLRSLAIHPVEFTITKVTSKQNN